jgi:hypothetical protein
MINPASQKRAGFLCKLVKSGGDMASTAFQIVKQSDEDIIHSIKIIASECQLPAESTISILLSKEQQALNTNLGNIDESLKYLLSLNSSVIYQFNINLSPKLKGASLTLQRGQGYDNATLHYANDADFNTTSKVLAACNKYLKAFDRKEYIEKLLGEELSEFYRSRETALIKLESLSEKLIRTNEEYRHRLDQEFSEGRIQLNKEFQGEKQNLHDVISEREKELKIREEALEKRTKEIDDRDNIHARRQIRLDLKKELAQRSQAFNLTKSTSSKRAPVHALFILLILTAGLIFAKAFYDNIGSTMDNWIIPLKLGLSAAAFAAALIFYIRWNDQWFRQHADEEFKLKRLELDVDRASWVVEMAHEWKESEIPEVLLQNLSKNLFSTEKEEMCITHPSEDLASALLGACTGVTVKIPNFGEMVLNRKDLKKFQKTLEEPKK